MIYTVALVERLLRNYLDIRYTLEGRGQQLPDTYATFPKRVTRTEQPLGMTAHGTPWPFMEPLHAKAPTDGKRKARLLEELHCSIIDIETALPHMSDDDLELIYQYHVLQTHTLDELAKERRLTSRGSMHQRVYRAVERLTRVLNE